MSYEQFVRQIEITLAACAGGGHQVYVRTTIKNNGSQRVGITFAEAGLNISPTIYLEEYYDQYLNGISIEYIAKQVMNLYRQVKFQDSWEGKFVKKFANVKDRITYQLINRKANEELLGQIPFTPYHDLAVVYSVMLELKRPEQTIATMRICNEHLSWWEVSKEELHEMAHKNTEKLLPYEFMTMYAAVERMFDNSTGEEPEQEDHMYVLTNNVRNYGASAMLYENRLKSISSYLGEDYYVLPSSVHEIIVVPESKAPSHRDLCGIVKEINDTQVLAEEVLSDYAYLYNKEKERLEFL